MPNYVFEELFKGKLNEFPKSYIKYFFNEVTNIETEDVYYKELEENVYISIVKDSYKRILEGSGRAMHRTWRNILFLPYPKEGVTNRNELNEYAENVFKRIQSEYSYLFVRSYVYFVFIKETVTGEITKSNLDIFYFDTNYKFGRAAKSNLFGSTKNIVLIKEVDNELNSMNEKNMDVIDCAKAYHGMLDIYELTKMKLESIKSNIKSNSKSRILIQGPARSGKTIIAMSLLHEYPESILILYNYYFYAALIDAFTVIKKEFPKNRIFHHDISAARIKTSIVERIKEDGRYYFRFKRSLPFIIVDEAQRLANLPKFYSIEKFPQLDIMTEEPRVAVFLGDTYQRIRVRYDMGLEKIKINCLKLNIPTFEYEFNETIGIPINIVNSIKFMLYRGQEHNEKISLGNFKIELTQNPKRFVEGFESESTLSKHYAHIPYAKYPKEFQEHKVYFSPKSIASGSFPYFLNEEILGKYSFSTFNLISREMEMVYIMLGDDIRYSEELGIHIVPNNQNMTDEFLINNLYVLMTRATQKVVLYVNDNNLYNHLMSKLSFIKDNEVVEVLDETEIS